MVVSKSITVFYSGEFVWILANSLSAFGCINAHALKPWHGSGPFLLPSTTSVALECVDNTSMPKLKILDELV